MWAVVGLGNPGREYSRTRHNAGFLFLKQLAKNWGVRIRKPRCQAKIAIIPRGNEDVLLAMPQTFMNRSGAAVKQMVDSYALDPLRICVVYDDFDLPLGRIRIRKEGGAGSHKGMASIIEELSTSQIPRIRIGIGPLPENEDASDFVLSPFTKEEEKLFKLSLEGAEKALEKILAHNIEAAMNDYNRIET